MKDIYFLPITFAAFFTLAIPGSNILHNPATAGGLREISTIENNDTAGWVNNFRVFRNALYHHDKARCKDFVSLPLLNFDNAIWNVALGGDEKKLRQIPDTPKAFTERDFDAYFDHIFPKEFITSILKIKSEDLYKNGIFATPEFKENSHVGYKMIAVVKKAEGMLTLNLLSKDSKWEDGGEHSIVYDFEILNNRDIKLKQVLIAD